MRRNLTPVAVGLVLLYVVLTISAAGCFFLHALPSSHHHHDQSSATHSILCAWVCEANPIVAALTAAPQAAVFSLVAMLWLARAVPFAGLFQVASHSRAPPY